MIGVWTQSVWFVWSLFWMAPLSASSFFFPFLELVSSFFHDNRTPHLKVNCSFLPETASFFFFWKETPYFSSLQIAIRDFKLFSYVQSRRRIFWNIVNAFPYLSGLVDFLLSDSFCSGTVPQRVKNYSFFFSMMRGNGRKLQVLPSCMGSGVFFRSFSFRLTIPRWSASFF